MGRNCSASILPDTHESGLPPPYWAGFLRAGGRLALSCERVTGPVQLDDLDRQILELLSEDARRTIADIASRVNLSPAPVKRRIDRLQRLGVIAGYTVVLDHARLGPSIDAFTELRFAGDADIDEILTAVEQIPEISEVFTMAGDPDALLHIRVDDVEHLKQVVNQLRRTGRVTGTKTLMVLDHWTRAEGPPLAAE
jgi:Lrp/AsnC family transcriptional regulator, leucine-responsive regulatory protein